MFDWFNAWWASVVIWFELQRDALFELLDPGRLLLWLAEQATAMLPEPSDISFYLNGLVGFTSSLASIYQFLDYFFNMPVFSSAMTIIVTIEAWTNVPRLWRFIVSLRFW